MGRGQRKAPEKWGFLLDPVPPRAKLWGSIARQIPLTDEAKFDAGNGLRLNARA
jgi:hypothetical protein